MEVDGVLCITIPEKNKARPGMVINKTNAVDVISHAVSPELISDCNNRPPSNIIFLALTRNQYDIDLSN